MLVIFLGILFYLGVYVWRGMTDSFVTTIAYEYTADDSVEASGIIVRQELVLPGQSGIVDFRLDEGEKVGAGQAVAYLYQTEEAVQRQDRLRQLSLEAEQLEYAMAQTDTGDSVKLDETIVDQMVALRASAARGDFTGLEDQVLELKSTVLKRDYTYGGTPEGSSLRDQLSAVQSEMRTLRSQASQDTRSVTAPQSGTFSALVDGYETLIGPDTVESLTPSTLEQLLEQKVSEDEGALCKLITSPQWQFAAVLEEEDALRLSEGDKVTLRFSRDFSADIAMTVDWVGQAESGRTVVVFSSSEYLAQMTLLRRQTVEVIFESRTGIRVPKQSVHLETQTVTAEDGSETEQTVYGVYAVVGARAEFKTVEIVGESGAYYIVRSVDSDKTALRPGNEIIVSASGVYDGKVVR